MSSLAQEESRSISGNVTWGKRKAFQDGKVSLPYKTFLGYKKGEDGLPEIVEKEADLVRRIYRMFLSGINQSSIARTLIKEKIPTPGGKTHWQYSTIDSILRNEKYKGSALLQKRYTVDSLQRKLRKMKVKSTNIMLMNLMKVLLIKMIGISFKLSFMKKKKYQPNHVHTVS